MFDPDRVSIERLRSDFLARLALSPKQGEANLSLSTKHLLALGKATREGGLPDLNEDLSNLSTAEKAALLREALTVATVSHETLMKALKGFDASLTGGRGYLVAVAGSGHGGLSELPWEGHAAGVRQSVLHDADLFFSSNDSDRDFLLGLTPDTPEDECIRRFRTLKPCVWGSDAKSLENLLHPSDGKTDRYTWIKSDPSFEGLKQLVYEPAHRVAIQDQDPDQRPWNAIIDAVRFRDDTATGLASEEWIPLNSCLTTIIGGKSSGKSLLLHLIAKTIDPAQVRERAVDGEAPYDRLEQDLSFEVRWKNDDLQTLDGAEVAPSRITYLPQNYINRLAEPESHEQLEDVILRLLREDEDFAAAEDALRVTVSQSQSSVSEQVQRLFEVRRQIGLVRERIADLGNAEAIQSEIRRLQEEQAEIRKAAGMTELEETAFGRLRAVRETLEEAERALQTEAVEISEFADAVTALRARSVAEVRTYTPPAEASESRLAGLVTSVEEAVTAAFDAAAASIAAMQEEIVAESAAVRDQAAERDRELEPFQAKMQSRERAESLAESGREAAQEPT